MDAPNALALVGSILGAFLMPVSSQRSSEALHGLPIGVAPIDLFPQQTIAAIEATRSAEADQRPGA
jgi:hypothetical protein